MNRFNLTPSPSRLFSSIIIDPTISSFSSAISASFVFLSNQFKNPNSSVAAFDSKYSPNSQFLE
ncbi:MAG: hypothetical protein RBS85_01590 [Methanofastidiosum sp.]|jgi:hypothetical protein|nr:hypothetical protein [Methanofastidiosum sp.]